MESLVPRVRRRGRPRKFDAPSRAVTLTLPDAVIEALSAVDPDLSRAIVRLAQPQLARRPRPAAELTVFGHRAVIVVKPTRTLEKRTGVMLVPLSDGRALISFDAPMTVAQLELRLQDAIDDPDLPRGDVQVFSEVRRILRDARQSRGIGVEERSIIVMEGLGRTPARSPRKHSAA